MDTVRPFRAATPRIVAAGLLASWRVALITGLVVLLAALTVALLIPTTYRAESSLVVMPGMEYTYRPGADEVSQTNGVMDHDQIARTEVSILVSDDLARGVLRKIGVGTLYPTLVAPPNLLERTINGWWQGAQTLVARFVPDLLPLMQATPQDPVERALPRFRRDLGVEAAKLGSVINLSFRNRDGEVAARTLTVLTQLYLARREALVTTPQAALVNTQAQLLRDRLNQADAALAEYKLQNGIAGFASRQDILLHAQGALESDQLAAARDLAQAQARLAVLRPQLTAAAPTVMQESASDIDGRVAAMRASIDALRAKVVDVRAHYRPDSPEVRDAAAQLAVREGELDRLRRDTSASTTRLQRNPLVTSLEAQISQAETDARAATARQQSTTDQLQMVATKLGDLSAREIRLEELQRDRAMLDEQYRSASGLLEQRRIAETVEAKRMPSVRVLQAPVAPIRPLPLRRLIALAGLGLAVLAGVTAALLAHYMRAVYLLPEAVERDLDLQVLVSVPDTKEIGHLPKLSPV